MNLPLHTMPNGELIELASVVSVECRRETVRVSWDWSPESWRDIDFRGSDAAQTYADELAALVNEARKSLDAP